MEMNTLQVLSDRISSDSCQSQIHLRFQIGPEKYIMTFMFSGHTSTADIVEINCNDSGLGGFLTVCHGLGHIVVWHK
jgi:hypothetical protein